MGIGFRIKEARERLGLTQTELGKLVGVTGSAITNYEKETSHPKEPVIYKLLEVLDVDANYLFQDCMKKNIYADTATPEEFEKIIKKYRALDDRGRKMVDSALEEAYNTRPQIDGIISLVPVDGYWVYGIGDRWVPYASVEKKEFGDIPDFFDDICDLPNEEIIKIINKYEAGNGYGNLYANAAHPDETATDEEREAGDNMMKDDSEWGSD